MKRIIITIVVILGSAALIAWILNKNKQENEAKTAVVAQTNMAVAVNAEPVTKQAINLDFSSNGNFSANQDLKLMAEAGGRITSILVREGARVSKGQVLAHIDAEYASLDVQRVEDALNKLKTDHARYKSSYETGGVTKAQLDEVELGLRNTENQLQQARRRLQDAYVKAPISGVINKRSIEIGAYVSPGTELFEIVDVSKLKLNVLANETQVVQIKVGDKVSISSSVFPDKNFSGTISFIAVKADNSLNYPVEILVDNPGSGAELRAGMYATAHFKFPQQDPAILIPRGTFIGSVNSNKVYVLGADSTAQVREVIPGRILGEQVEILSGLQEGETVITSGQINLTEGLKVAVQQ
ncbi:MAG TPA: efflux RND transporter periplasmic adaptor subunit [Sphingobacteriaceae bacterium]|nr:efflux RND transporter periplasmic adaptor subunit [Sphingobacteriaceae bacterium]